MYCTYFFCVDITHQSQMFQDMFQWSLRLKDDKISSVRKLCQKFFLNKVCHQKFK